MDTSIAVSTATNTGDLQEMNDKFSEWMAQDQPNSWAIGLQDMPLYSLIDPNGCITGKINNKLVINLCALNYNDSYSFIGAFWSDPSCRGRGLGSQVFSAGIRHCGARTIGLYAAPKLVHFYERYGFRSVGTMGFYTLQKNSVLTTSQRSHIVALDKIPFEILIDFDSKFFPFERSKFLAAWIKQKDVLSVAFVENDVLKGYGVLRSCYNSSHFRLGPLFCDTVDVAVVIMAELMSRLNEDALVFFESLCANPNENSFVEQIGAEKDEEVASVMWRGQEPSFRVDGVFAVTAGDIG